MRDEGRCSGSVGKAPPVKKLQQWVCFTNVGIADRQKMLFAGAGNHFDRAVGID
jgi:hypothetical protein